MPKGFEVSKLQRPLGSGTDDSVAGWLIATETRERSLETVYFTGICIEWHVGLVLTRQFKYGRL